MIVFTKEELMMCSKETLVDIVLRYKKMLDETYKKVDELYEAFRIKPENCTDEKGE